MTSPDGESVQTADDGRGQAGTAWANSSVRAAGRLSIDLSGAAQTLLLVFAVSLIFSIGIGGLLSVAFPLGPHEAHELMRSFGLWGPLGLVGVIAVIIVLVPVPTIPFDIAAGVGYGVLPGSGYVLLGHLLGASVAFLLARRFGHRLLKRVVPRQIAVRVDGMSGRLSTRMVVVMRLLPLFDFKVVSYASGLATMSFGGYILATAAGIALPIFGMVAIGAQLRDHPLRAALIVGTFGLVAGAGAAYLLFGRDALESAGG